MILNIVVDTPLKVGQIFDVAGIGLNDGVYRFRLPCGCLYNRFIGQQFVFPIPQSRTPPFLFAVNARQSSVCGRLHFD